jgi:hypothetical protein
MNPILIFSLIIIPFFKDITKAIGDSKEAKAFLILVSGYFLYSYFKKKQDQADYSGSADAPQENLKYAEWAKRMHSALHPFLPYKVPTWIPILGGYFADGTNEKEVELIAKEVGLVKGYAKLSEAYKVLFGDDLQASLLEDGVLQIFNTAYQNASGSTAPRPTPNTNVPSGERQLTKGATIYAYAGWRLRTINGAIVRNTTAGEEFQIVSWKTETIAGTTGIWVEVKKKGITNITTYKIFLKGLYFKA